MRRIPRERRGRASAVNRGLLVRSCGLRMESTGIDALVTESSGADQQKTGVSDEAIKVCLPPPPFT